MIKRFFPFSYIFVIIALFFYTFTQVDLSLTLSQASFLQTVQQSFQQIGYFQRPLSTQIFLIIVVLLFIYYSYFLYLASKNKISRKKVWIIILITSGILAISYNAFSYDLFNYIFDAKIITFYHENPYTHKALDFTGDPMLSFMHWTHRYYPYGPFWLVLTTPLSFLGFNVFLITFFIFKLFIAFCFVMSCYLISKIVGILNPKYVLISLVFFALNPLVLVESLVSAHNDIPMIMFALLGIYYFFLKKRALAIIFIVLSALIKIPTVVLLFPVLVSFIPQRFMKISLDNQKYVWMFVILSVFGLFYSMTKLEIQPWYFMWVIPFVALIRPNKYLMSLVIGMTLGLLLRYSVFIYFGNWEGEAVYLRNSITVIASLFPLSLLCMYDLLIQIFGNKKIGRKS